MDDNSVKRVGLNFSEVLQIVFITLKLLNVIDWSWWWVLAPTWIGLIILIIIVIILLIIDTRDK